MTRPPTTGGGTSGGTDGGTGGPDSTGGAHGTGGTGGTDSSAGAAGGGRAALRILQVAVATSSLDRFAISPLLLMIAADMGASLSQVAAAASAYFLAYGLMQPVWGMLGDRIGLVRVMRIAMLVAGLTGLASAFAPNVLVLALLRTVAGACFGGVNPSGLVYVGTVWPEGIRQRALADLAAATSSGLAVATAGAGLLGDLSGWRVVLGTTATVALLLSFLLRGSPHRLAAGPARRCARSAPCCATGGRSCCWG
jgi:MFS family permease